MLLFGVAEGGYYTTSSELPWIWGDVSAEAQVTINGTPVPTAHIGSSVFGPDWWRFNEDPEAAATVPLVPGGNTITVTATFADDSQLSRTIRIWSDPTLVESEGYLVALTDGDPPTATIEQVAFVHDEWGISDPGAGSTTLRVPVAADAVFVAIPWQPAGRIALLLNDMLTIQGANQNGPLEGYWWRHFFAPSARDQDAFPAPWTFLTTKDGHLQQASQLYSP